MSRSFVLLCVLLVGETVSKVSNCVGRSTVQVFTDIDDTLTSPARATRAVDGGSDYAWARNRNLHNIIYPGILAFESMLAKGPTGSVRSETGVVWLSSRPEELVQLTGSTFIGSEIDLGLRAAHGFGVRDALYGSVEYVVPGDHSRYTLFGLGKVSDFNTFASTYASENACYHFVGDNGQGDVLAGIEIQKHANAGAVFIHSVKLHDADLKIDSSAHDFHYYFTAMGAALQAHCAGYITKNAVKFVRESIRASAERRGCLRRCEPDCLPLIDKCSDDECNADPDTGYAPGCRDLLCDVEVTDRFLDGALSCDAAVSLVDATPSYAAASKRPSTRQCSKTLDDMAAYEATKSVDTAFLADKCSVFDDQATAQRCAMGITQYVVSDTTITQIFDTKSAPASSLIVDLMMLLSTAVLAIIG